MYCSARCYREALRQNNMEPRECEWALLRQYFERYMDDEELLEPEVTHDIGMPEHGRSNLCQAHFQMRDR